MAFQQLYYTSCEHGLSGYPGYQFNAITPGVPAAVLREVEERTLYEPPRWRKTNPGADEPEAYPIAFSYGVSETTGMTVTAHVVFSGADYSGRPGNYFVHALVSGAPQHDFGALLPVELWGAPLWQRAPVDGTELPELPGPLPRGVIDRPGVQAFLDARGGQEVLAELLTAIGRAMAGAQPVLVASQDASENAWWIAAVCYLMGEHVTRRMTFTTYSHRPGYAAYHLVGILADMIPPDARGSFQLFDFTAGRRPGHEPHPLAAMLASTGVLAAPELWQQATVFASGTEENLDDWLAPVAVAAGLLGRKLTAGEMDTVAGWLPAAAGWLPPQIAEIALGVALTQADGALPDDRLAGLLSLARRLPAAAHTEQLERVLAGRAIGRIIQGDQTQPVQLGGAAAAAAEGQVIQALGSSPPAVARALLDWALASGVGLPDTELERYGRTRLDPGTAGQELVPILRGYPAILRGLLGRLAGEPPEVTKALLGGPAGAQLTRDDLAAHPDLTELWLLQSALNGSIPKLRAFDEIVDVRAGAGRSPRADGTLLRLLWPGGCPPGQITELLGILTDPPGPDIVDWFAGEVSAICTRGTNVDDWVTLAEALNEHPVLALLPEAETRSVHCAIRVVPLLRRAYLAGPPGDVNVFAQLFAEYAEADGNTRRLLERDVPALLAQASSLGSALPGCPEGVAVAFGQKVTDRLAPLHPDVALAARVFAALIRPDVRAQPRLTQSLAAAFDQVRRWRRQDLGALAGILDRDAETAQSFQTWRDTHTGGRRRRLFRGGPGFLSP
jgi:GTPase-associated protein 1, N-terminal domain type 2/GTPase-associated protein 1, C-terminal domain/GTPase-associated protein 1, middle domain